MSRQIETSITINAPPERVWGILTDFRRMPEWNPFITAISGPLQPQGRLSVRITPPGKRSMTFSPTVLVVRTGRELRWIGRVLISGIFDGEHYFLLEPEGEGQTRLVQGETFNGVLVRLLGGALSSTEAGFNAMNQALKVQAEMASVDA